MAVSLMMNHPGHCTIREETAFHAITFEQAFSLRGSAGEDARAFGLGMPLGLPAAGGR